jgi:hypothetical protein
MLTDEWQPIGTAPRNGTLVLAACESKMAAHWQTFRFPYPLKQRWNGVKWEADDGHVYDPQPTHWMPLPPPPMEKTNAD